MRQRAPRQHDEQHLAFIRQLPCLTCGNDIETQAAHIRFADEKADKRYCGKQEKPDDIWALPLCGTCHGRQHHVGERAFWNANDIDPIKVAAMLALNTGDHEAGCRIVLANRIER